MITDLAWMKWTVVAGDKILQAVVASLPKEIPEDVQGDAAEESLEMGIERV
jgi:hypothetical protein